MMITKEMESEIKMALSRQLVGIKLYQVPSIAKEIVTDILMGYQRAGYIDQKMTKEQMSEAIDEFLNPILTTFKIELQPKE